MGYILDGTYHKGEPPLEKLRNRQQSTWKSHDHNRQRQDYAKEIIQPFDRKGNVNPDFVAAYPEESKERGFLPTEEQLKQWAK